MLQRVKTNAVANELAGAPKAQPGENPASIPSGQWGRAPCKVLFDFIPSPELVLQDRVEKLVKGRYHNFNSKWPKAFVSNKWTSSFKAGN